jgi:hypothetical protein
MSRFRPQTVVDEQLVVLKPHERPEGAEVDDVYVEADKVGVGSTRRSSLTSAHRS